MFIVLRMVCFLRRVLWVKGNVYTGLVVGYGGEDFFCSGWVGLEYDCRGWVSLRLVPRVGLNSIGVVLLTWYSLYMFVCFRWLLVARRGILSCLFSNWVLGPELSFSSIAIPLWWF